ncbi:MAG TPA: hypothetical protein VMU99_02275 [Acidimicrobiales bacterium]|nr:hypothetical protein [Acidimicrobiales bacterium]
MKCTDPKTGTRVHCCRPEGPVAKVACPLTPSSLLPTNAIPLQNPPPEGQRGACCSQTSISVRWRDDAKYEQELCFSPPEWRALHEMLRNHVEGRYGTSKDSHESGFEKIDRRRTRGQGPTNFLLAVFFAGQSMPIIDNLWANTAQGTLGHVAGSGRPRRLSSGDPSGD